MGTIDWEAVFETGRFKPGATAPDLEEFAATVFLPPSDLEIAEGRASLARNPFHKSDPLYESYDPSEYDPARWTIHSAPLPPAYLDFLGYSNGGDFGNGDRWFQMFSCLHNKGGVRAMMMGYHIPEWMPGALPFAFNGAGYFYLFDMRPAAINGEYPIVTSHAGNLGWEPDDHWRIADTFLEACRGSIAIEDLDPSRPPPSEYDDIPLHGSVYVAGVPTNGIKILLELKKYLNADWPVSKFRELLASQPFLGKSDSYPRGITSSLGARPELAPYLFWKKDDELIPLGRLKV